MNRFKNELTAVFIVWSMSANICLDTHTHTHTVVYIHIYVCTQFCMCICIYTHTHTKCVCVYIYIYVILMNFIVCNKIFKQMYVYTVLIQEQTPFS